MKIQKIIQRHLSAAIPKVTLPSKTPNWNTVCVKLANHLLSHIKSHSMMIVLEKIDVSYTGSAQGHVSVSFSPHV